MNKDLDERLVPNGQYRDAMNVQVSTSEESEVGTVQNILGNTRVEDIVNVSNASCVGAIADEKNDVLYWFITSPDVDAIIEYRDDGVVTPVLVDRNKDVLKFDPLNIITGINIIDNLLFWTDDINEPKKINIDAFKLNPSSNGLNVHSSIFVNGVGIGAVTEDHITVIRKRPQKAPTVVFSETSIQPISNFYDNQDNQGNGPITTPGFTDPGGLNFYNKTVGSTYYGAIIVDPFDLITYQNGQILLLSQPSTIGNLPQNYQIKIKIISPPVYYPATGSGFAPQGHEFDFEILEMDQNYANDEVLQWDAVLEVDEDPIFEKDFIRFATRWKYADGEYSAFSPFTQPVFLTGAFGFHPTEDPYNLAMQSQALSIRLQDLIPSGIPNDVTQLDILFKKERSTTIYSIDSIKPNDPSPNYWNKNDYANQIILTDNYPVSGSSAHQTQFTYDYTGEYEITVENIYAALPENQLLRPWDNVPRKALAQEITANRVVYGNYLQNYNLKDYLGNITKPNIVVDKEERLFNDNTISFSNGIGKKSIKSLRTYYLGIVYGDKQGRETPIFTSKDASVHIPYDLDDSPIFNGASNKSLRLTAELWGDQPGWAYYYKYFVKQTTGEYYNLTMDRVYKSQEDKNLWLSFPSSDRNKVQEGDYIILKKQVDIESIVPVEEKIKIIDIKNEAPESIKYNFISLGTGGGTAIDNSKLFPDINQHPGEGVGKLLIDREAWTDTEGGIDLVDGTTSSDRLAVQFSIVQNGNTIKSKKYFVSAWALEDSGNNGRYSLLLRQIVDAEDSWVESSSGVLNSAAAFNISIFKLDEKDVTEFEGRFFMKVISNTVTQTYLVPSSSDADIYRVTGKMDTFTLADAVGNLGGSVDGIYNTEQSTWTQTSSNAITDTEGEWDTVTTFDTSVGSSQGFFIDYISFVAAQEDTGVDIDAGISGRMTKGNPLKINQYINGLEGIVSPDQTAGKYRIDNSPSPQQGARHWSSVVSPMLDNHTAFQYLSNADFDNTYLPSLSGGHYMHLSYSCIGEDLHDGTLTEGTTNAGGPDDYLISSGSPPSNAIIQQDIKENLQGIYASQGFVGSGTGASNLYSNSNDLSNSQYPGNLSTEEQENSQNQFNPAWKNPYAKSVIDNLIAGNRFQIDGDPEIYTILKVNKKFLYNHTAWNLAPTFDSPDTVDADVNIDQHSTANGDISNVSVCEAWTRLNGSGFNHFKYNDFKEILTNFGKANNRRVCYILELDKNPTQQANYATSLGTSDHDTSVQLRFVDNYMEDGSNTLPTSPAIFETEAKEDQDLNIYYEASDALPVKLEENPTSMTGHLLGPVGCKVTCSLAGTLPVFDAAISTPGGEDIWTKVKSWSGNQVELNSPGLIDLSQQGGNNNSYIGHTLTFYRKDLSYAQAKILSVDTISNLYITHVTLELDTHKEKTGLPYYNCFSFGNGVESNRIRDDFNESYILNGVKASTVLEEPYEEERRKYGLIYSGLYNSTSGVNNLNQFIQAEKITKDLMPSYGSIQKLYARDKDLVTLCEDKVIRIYVDKDILFNADGNSQLLATNRVLGTAEPFRGNYGISKNPESFAAEAFRAYFTDKQRGAVLRLSIDGLTPTSDAGMHDYFRDNLENKQALQGNYDAHKGNYNLTMLTLDEENKITNGEFNTGTQNLVELSELITNFTFNNVTTTTTNTPTWALQTAAAQGGNYTNNTLDFPASSLPLLLPGNVSPLVGQYILSIDNDNNGVNEYTTPSLVTAQVTAVNQNNGQVTLSIINNVNQTTATLNDMVTGGLGGFAYVVFGDLIGTVTVTTTDDWLPSIVTNTGPGTLELVDGDILNQPTTMFNSGTLYRVEIVVGAGAMWSPGTNTPSITINNATFLPSSVPGVASIDSPGTYVDDMILAGPFSLNLAGGDLNIESISVKELVPQGGTALNWDLFEGATEDGELEFLENPQRISFNSTSTDLKRLSQIITNHTIEQNVNYRLNFKISNYQSGTLKPYLRADNDGVGIDFNHVVGNGNYQMIDSVSSGNTSFSPFTSYENRLIFETNDFKGDIDSISLYINGYAGKTVSFNEKSKGWVSFKSFVPEFGISCVNQYYTMRFGQLWKHHTNETRNNFYGTGPDQDTNAESSITPILNTQPAVVKNFNTLNYEGSKSKIDQFLTYEVASDQPFPIGDNLIIPTGQMSAQFFMQAPNSSASFTNTTNNISVVDLHGESGTSDWIQIMVPNLDTNKTYRLSFNFSVTGQSGQSHVYFGASSISLVISTSLNNGVFSEDFTPSNNTEYVYITHPNLLNGFTQDVNVELTNVLLQELDFTTDENDGEYYNLQTKTGWYVSDIHTDKQEGTLNEFIEKEGKWFNYIKGKPGQIDPAAFNFQGLGIVETIE